MTPRLRIAASILAGAAFAFLAALSLTGCAGKTPANPQSATVDGSAQPAIVETIRPTREDLKRVTESMPAELLPYEQTDLTAKIAGYVQQIFVDYGDQVQGPRYDSSGNLLKEGQVLAELWVPEMVEELKQKDALVAQAKADVQQAEATLAAATANVKTALALVKEAEAGRARAEAMVAFRQSQYDRLSKSATQTADKQTMEETLYELRAAEAARTEVDAKVQSIQAARDESAAKRDKAEADVLAAKARVTVAEANRDQAKAMLQYARLTAPYDGVITRRNIHTGAYVTGKGGEQPLLTIVRTDKLRVTVNIPEKDVRFLKQDIEVEADLDALPGRKFAWTLSRFAPVLGAGKKVRGEVHVPNLDGSLYPGMYGHAVVVLENKKGSLTVPSTCLSTDDKGPFVFTVVEGTARKRPVTLGINDGRKAEIISGLDGTEQVISSGKDLIRAGQAVTIVNNRSSKDK